MHRRQLLTIAAAALAHAQRSEDAWHMPDEAGTHRRTWMAFGPEEEVWADRRQLEIPTNDN